MPRPARYAADIVESMSVKYSNVVYDKHDRGDDLIVLSAGEANFEIPLFRFDDLPMPAIYKYSHTRGIPPFRKLLAEHYGSRFGVNVDPETELLITAGSKVAIHEAFMAILNPGDDVLVPEPAWPSFPEQVRLCHARPVPIPFEATIAEYGRYVTPRTRAIVVNNPNNPTGRIMTRRDWQALHEFAIAHDLYIVSDEGYSDYVLEPGDFISAAIDDPAKSHTIVCNTLSKNYGMSGWRIGYVFTNADLLFTILKINQHLITCPATILEWYMVRHFHEVLAITEPQIRAVVLKRHAVARLLEDRGLRVVPGDATFYVFVSIEGSELRSEEFCQRLLVERGVATIPGAAYGRSCDRFLRIAVGTESMDRISTGIDRILQLIRETAVPLFVALLFLVMMITAASPALAQSAPAPAFELADVHVSPPRMVTNLPMAGGAIRQGAYVLRNATMVDLIRTAYEVEPEKIVGGPSWLEVDKFDVVAKVPDGATVKTARLMLRGLLAERFGLTVREERRDMKAWVLSAPHNGETKLVRPQSPDVAPSCGPEQVPPNFRLVCHNVSMDILADRLSHLGRLYAIGSVTNATGLSGGWDFALTFTPDKAKLGELGAEGISLFTALEQLGLKLEYTNIAANAIAVERVNRTPSANAPGIEAKLPPRPTPEFEVAELKPTAPGAKRRMQMLPNGRLNASAMPLRELIKLAWGFNGDQLVAGPKWIDTTQFDLIARVFSGADAQFVDVEFVRLALRKLLVERFQIKFHFEDRPVTAYALRPGNVKMAKADPAARTRCYVGVPPGAKDPREAIPSRVGLLTCQNVTMPFFAARLHEIAPGYIEAPIADQTGLAGGWNLTLNWSPIDMFPGGVNGFTGGAAPKAAATPDAGAAGPATASTPTGAITLPEAVASQLGLKLEMAKRPMPVLVIDAITEKPLS